MLSINQIPILMTSAYADMKAIYDARDAGVNEFLAKPITVAGLSKKLSRLFVERRPFIREEAYVGPCRRRHPDRDHNGPLRRAEDMAGAEAEDDVVELAI